MSESSEKTGGGATTDGTEHTGAESGAGKAAASFEDMTDEQKRHDELTRAPKSDESDAAPRIETSTTADGKTRIDIAETAAVRPGNPDKQS